MWAGRLKRTERSDKIGILTFQCADNFGAMLQAYGLLTWLSRAGFDAFIVNYVPPFLRGREWLLPYIPLPGKGPWAWFRASLRILKKNVVTGKDWRLQKRRMNEFRKKYLVCGGRTFYRMKTLSQLKADILIVGSDQIWNPDITVGLRPAYFGAFENHHIRKTIAYAASFGTGALPRESEDEFEKLLTHVHEISMREKSAAKYIEMRFQRKASYVLDPVFLLAPEEWHKIEDMPKECGFILYYETEHNNALRKAASRFAQKKKLKVLELKMRKEGQFGSFQTIYTAGPAQFLGYLDAAQCVFTNSFHGVAFSILLHKPFYVCNHRTVGARIESLLNSAGLVDRMQMPDANPDCEKEIEWADVEQRLKPYRQQGIDFLRANLTS